MILEPTLISCGMNRTVAPLADRCKRNHSLLRSAINALFRHYIARFAAECWTV